MHCYCWENLDVGHSWDLKGYEGKRVGMMRRGTYLLACLKGGKPNTREGPTLENGVFFSCPLFYKEKPWG